MNINTFKNTLNKVQSWFVRGHIYKTFLFFLVFFSLLSLGQLYMPQLAAYYFHIWPLTSLLPAIMMTFIEHKEFNEV